MSSGQRRPAVTKWPARLRDGVLVLCEYAAEALLSLFRPDLRHPGATSDEQRRELPGDDVVPAPSWSATRAITIDVGPADVWPWLVQMGYGRGGFYGDFAWWHDERGGKGARSSAETIHPELQELHPGDVLLDGPNCSATVGAWTVHEITAGRHLVLTTSRTLLSGREVVALRRQPRAFFRCSWAFVLDPGGSSRTRLLVRSRIRFVPGWLRHVVGLLQAGDTAMQLAMLRGIKRRAEGAASAPGLAPATGSEVLSSSDARP